MSYQDVKDKLHHGHRKVANNTYLAYENEFHGDYVIHPIIMKLHGNVVARFYPDHIELHSAGWHTVTTRSRLNLALRLAGIHGSISQYKYQWYIDTNLLNVVEFKDGMKISYTGEILSHPPIEVSK
ncbi:hypothetical protein LCGC14_0383300 [marine sediment metagenome]|uniref:Uncharacterized protein n=1 Tax=marine sediment metagenome TaxID=412755 RepID=A0A0F9VNV7_9ZZZZ